MSNNFLNLLQKQQELRNILHGNLNVAAANRTHQLIVNITRNHPYSHNANLLREARRRLNNYNLQRNSNSNSNNMNNLNWNSNGNIINFPRRLRNNRESFTLNSFRPGQRYVEVAHGNTRSYFNLNSFRRWWARSHLHPLLSGVNITPNNLRIVRFKN